MGEVARYYVTRAHEAIISPAVWDFVQAHQRHEELLQQHAALLAQIQSKNDRQAAYHYYKQELGRLDAETLEFSPYLCVAILESVHVTIAGQVQVNFRAA